MQNDHFDTTLDQPRSIELKETNTTQITDGSDNNDGTVGEEEKKEKNGIEVEEEGDEGRSTELINDEQREGAERMNVDKHNKTENGKVGEVKVREEQGQASMDRESGVEEELRQPIDRLNGSNAMNEDKGNITDQIQVKRDADSGGEPRQEVDIIAPIPTSVPPPSSLLSPSSANTTPTVDGSKIDGAGEKSTNSTSSLNSSSSSSITPSVSPAPSASTTTQQNPAKTTDRPVPSTTTATKRFSSSLSVNKKFLEKAGEKSKPEVKPVLTRTATPPVPAPVSTSHPRLMAGKVTLSTSNPSINLSNSKSTSTAGPPHHLSATSSAPGGWTKKAPSAIPSSTTSSSTAGLSSLSTTTKSTNNSTQSGAIVGGGTRGGSVPWATGAGGKTATYGGLGLGRGTNSLADHFPTAAEAAYAKEARARAAIEQMQARERALQARAAAAAAQDARLLQNLDAFRGVHLDPNAHHWDEDEEDDFLDTTIEFGDGTQYKITEEEEDAAAARAQEELSRRAAGGGGASEELREPLPSELARLETPLSPGEVDVPVKREERFGDDYDRSWPPKRPVQPPQASPKREDPMRITHSEREDGGRNLYNDRLGRFEPAQQNQNSTQPSAIHHRRMSSGGGGGQDVPPHLLDRRDSASKHHSTRRPSITSPRMNHQTSPPLHHEPPRSGWPTRRPSNDMPVPSQGRQLPPHLAAAAAAAAPSATTQSSTSVPSSRPSAPTPSAVAPSKILSPPAQPLARLPETSAPEQPNAETPAPPSEADLEALHAREMHAAAERAKKRRQEEEQARLEQIERAKKKAAELEERMRPKVVEPVVSEKTETEKVKEEEKGKGASSWRSTARPPPVQTEPQASSKPETLQTVREALPPAQPTSILSRPPNAAVPPPSQKPSQPSLPSATQPPTGPSAWRRPSNVPPREPAPPPTGPRAQPERQLPPHLVNRSQPPAPSTEPSSVVSPPIVSPPIEKASKPVSSPPASSPPTVPSSPSHDRKLPPRTNALGYKLPEVSQLDDLMSRIKGAMTAKEKGKGKERDVAEVSEEREEQGEKGDSTAKVLEGSAPAPTVRLPTVGKLSRSRSTEQNLASLPTEPRGRGRGRTEGPRQPRIAQPAFENREPVLPFSASRRARSRSPPPAWKAYAVRLPAHPHRRSPLARNVNSFFSLNHPRPALVFSFQPLIQNINPRRLNRDEALIPKKYSKGVLQYSVKIPSERITKRTKEEQAREDALNVTTPIPTVNIASTSSLVRAAAPEGPESVTTKEELATVTPRSETPLDSLVGRGRGRGRGRLPDSDSWRRVGEALESTNSDAQEPQLAAERVEEAPASTETSPSRSRATAKSKLPLGSSIGFYRPSGAPPLADLEPLSSTSGEKAKMFMVTSELNGEKVESTPREETTAPGVDLAARAKMTPSSPVFKPKDVSSVLSSPSAAWTNKSLALSVLDPTASSVWSAAPVDASVRARATSGNQQGNSLEGIVDDDPSEALPSSLAELKSEDEQSNEGKDTAVMPKVNRSKEDAKLRAVAPSFSSFLHDSAAAIDTSSSSIPPSSVPPPPLHTRPQPLAFPSYAHQPIPQSTPSPVNAYSPSAAAYSPQLHHAALQYTRPYPPTYGMSTANVSPYVAQPSIHQSYSPASPVVSPLGYPPAVSQTPSTFARPPSQPIPHGITNPALIANYGYGQAVVNSARYGAVGAGPRPPPSNVPSQSPYTHGRAYSTPAPPSSFVPQPSPYNPSPAGYTLPPSHSQPYRTDLSSSSYPHSSHLGGNSSIDSNPYSRPYTSSGSTTMPSPVIVPTSLPPPPSQYQQQQQPPSSYYPTSPANPYQQQQLPLTGRPRSQQYEGVNSGYGSSGANVGRNGITSSAGGIGSNTSRYGSGARGW